MNLVEDLVLSNLVKGLTWGGQGLREQDLDVVNLVLHSGAWQGYVKLQKIHALET